MKVSVTLRRRQLLAAPALLAVPALLLPYRGRAADTPFRIGFLASYTGISGVNGPGFDAAIALVMRERGDTIAGRKVEVLKRDTTGPAPDVTRRLAQELIVRDKVDILAGTDFTPNAIAAGGISTQAKVPLFVVNAATTGILGKNPYMVRFGFTTAQIAAPLAEWAVQNGVKSVFTLASDYGPGIEASKVFNKTFTDKGGTLAGNIGLPLSSPDFSAYVQRVADAKPDAVFAFAPSGEQPITLMRTMHDAGLLAKLKLLATGDLVEESVLDKIGEAALGAITSYDYSDAHDSPTNKKFVAGFKELAPKGVRPNFMAVACYDVFNKIYDVAGAQGGKIDPDKTIELLKGAKWESPRGPVLLEDDRDLSQNVYIRRVERVNGTLQNIEFKTYPMVPAPPTLT
ncbi:MAG TPA: ABC transporter substrate-binding protein [Acetobacteraceae bacterium]|nr:ABC transporter substrate-binding protein [Acetobacteraceae bacterium]